jgi:hypothetical protein
MTGELTTYADEHRPGKQLARRIVAGVAVAALAACSSGGGNEAAPTQSAVPSASSVRPGVGQLLPSPSHTAKPGSNAPCRLENAGMTASIRAAGDVVNVSRQLVGKTIDMAPHTTNGECYEQVTFHFGGGSKVAENDMPGVYASYVKPPVRLKPSDKKTFVDGNAFLEVNMGSWWYAQGGGQGATAFADARMDNVKVVQETQNSEGVSTWVVGVDSKQPFTVEQVSDTPGCPQLCYVLKIQKPAA